MKKAWSFYREMSSAVRSSLWFTICNFLQRGTALITVPIFTRLLTTEEYGLCNIYFTWFEIFVVFTSLKMPYEGLNNGLIRYEKDKDGYTSSVAGAIFVLTVVVGALCLPFHRWISKVTGLNSVMLLLLLLQLLLNPMLYLWTNREKFDFRYRLPVIVTLVSTVLSPLISVATVMNTEYRAEARVMGTVLVQSLFGLVCCIFLFIKGKKFYCREYWKFGITFNLPLIFYYLSQFVLNQSDRLMIRYFEGSGKAGIYSVAYTAATLTLLFASAVNGSIHPWMYKKLKARCIDEIGKVLFGVSLMIAAAVIMMIAFAPDLVAILATAEYKEAIWIIPPVAASVYFMFSYMLFANIEMYYGATGYVSVTSILAALANLALNAIFIPMFGYMAAGWTTLVCYVLLAVLHYILMKRVCRKKGEAAAILQEKKMFYLSAVVLVMAVLMNGTYLISGLRYFVLAAAFVILFITRKKWLVLLKTIKKQ
ncbi:MAG: oligosaccharide flippase family protein [Lachnospiraceae bacterium]|nr:oligosaccharide flippase family protein [Lachnospiraceae bacterium]